MKHNSPLRNRLPSPLQGAGLVLLSALIVSLTGCGSSTQVYDSSKTIVYDGNIYNVTDVKVFAGTVEAVISESEIVDLKGAEKDEVNDLLDVHETLLVRAVFSLDDAKLVYQEEEVDSWSDFRDLERDFSSANSDIAEFMEDKKETQLELD